MDLKIPINLVTIVICIKGLNENCTCGLCLYKPSLFLFCLLHNLKCYLNLCLLDSNLSPLLYFFLSNKLFYFLVLPKSFICFCLASSPREDELLQQKGGLEDYIISHSSSLLLRAHSFFYSWKSFTGFPYHPRVECSYETSKVELVKKQLPFIYTEEFWVFIDPKFNTCAKFLFCSLQSKYLIVSSFILLYHSKFC